MNQREAFEAWQLDAGRTDPMWLGRGDGGNYGLNDVQAEWEVWQAAWQAALASQWHPIDTVPKDGTAVLAVVSGFQPVVVEFHPDCGLWYGDGNRPSEEWLDGTYEYKPDYWMPLPPEPTND